MLNEAFEARVQHLKYRAHGSWTPLLKALGVDEHILNRKNQPCPLAGCGAGVDRFQYTDKFGEGNYHCRKCGAGGGLKLAQGVLGLPFGELVKRIEALQGTMPVVPDNPSKCVEPGASRMKQLCQRIWREAQPVVPGDPVDRYLRGRGLPLEQFPRCLRCHPALGYFEKPDGATRAKKVAEYPAMLACVQGPDGRAVTLHRTYIQDGHKALGVQSKKVLSSGLNGAAIRLCEPTDELAIAEGIETALAVFLSTGKPVWAALNCGNLPKLWIPESVRCVAIYSDNDADSEFDGQLAAYALAHRLKHEAARPHAEQREVKVFVPKTAGTDWADVWGDRSENHLANNRVSNQTNKVQVQAAKTARAATAPTVASCAEAETYSGTHDTHDAHDANAVTAAEVVA